MIKTILFDYFNTLVYFYPTKEQICVEVFKKHGITVTPERIARSFFKAETLLRSSNTVPAKMDKQNRSEKMAFFTDNLVKDLHESGIVVDKLMENQIYLGMCQTSWTTRAFDDSLLTLKSLQDKGITTGLVSNIDRNIEDACNSLGLAGHLDFMLTSLEAGCEKPAPGIFLLALSKARAKPEEALFVGDQYLIDIVGAQKVGMKAVLIDRFGPEGSNPECPVIHGLSELDKYI
jgi:HAD superfamily hydrolase (TIGR01549 family)